MPRNAAGQRFEEIVQACSDDLHAYCLRRLPASEASDAVSEVFTTLWRRLDAVPPGDETRLWLFGVANNVVRNMSRSNRRHLRVVARVRGLAAEQPPGPEIQVVMDEEHRDIADAYRRLRMRDQEILRLRLWEELSTSETAAVLGCSDSAASKRYQRAVERLRKAARPSSSRSSVDERTRPHTTVELTRMEYEKVEGGEVSHE